MVRFLRWVFFTYLTDGVFCLVSKGNLTPASAIIHIAVGLILRHCPRLALRVPRRALGCAGQCGHYGVTIKNGLANSFHTPTSGAQSKCSQVGVYCKSSILVRPAAKNRSLLSRIIWYSCAGVYRLLFPSPARPHLCWLNWPPVLSHTARKPDESKTGPGRLRCQLFTTIGPAASRSKSKTLTILGSIRLADISPNARQVRSSTNSRTSK